MVPHESASTSNKDIRASKDNNNKEFYETVITYQTSEVGLHTTKDVLLDHLCAKIREVLPGVDAARASSQLLRGNTCAEIFSLLQHPKLLISKVQSVEKDASVHKDLKESPKDDARDSDVKQCVRATQQMEPLPQDKLQIGEDLFHKVAEIETELCAQITGMLLEMDKESLNKLLVDDDVLETAVSRAKTKYLVKQHPGILPGKEDMGEEIYEAVHNIYPEHAAKITGMLLEMDVAALQQLLESPSMLEIKAKMAFETVTHRQS